MRSGTDLADLPDANDRFDPESVYNPLTKGDLVDMQNSKFSLLRPSRRSLSPPASSRGPETSGRPSTARRSLAGGSSTSNSASRPAMASKAMATPGGPGLRSLDQLVTRLSEAMTSPPSQQQQQQQAGAKVPRDQALNILDTILAALRARCGSASASFTFLCSHGREKKHNNATKLVLLTHMLAAVDSMGLGMTKREVSAAFAIMADQRTGAITQSGLQHHFFRGIGALQTPSRATAEPSRFEIGKLTEYAREVWDNSAEAFVFFNAGGGEHLTKKDFSRSLKRMAAPDIDEEGLMRELDHDKDDKVGPREFIRMVASGWHSVGDHGRLMVMLEAAMAKRGSVEGKLESHVQRTRPKLPMPALKMSGSSSSEVMSKSVLGSSVGARQSPPTTKGGKNWDDAVGEDGNHSSSSPAKGVSMSQGSLEASNMSMVSQGGGATPADARRLAAVRIKQAKKKQEEAKKAAKQDEMDARRGARYDRIMRRIEEQSQVPRHTFQSGRKSHLRLFRKPGEDEAKVPYWPAPREGGFTPFMGDWDDSPWWHAQAERMFEEEEQDDGEQDEERRGGKAKIDSHHRGRDEGDGRDRFDRDEPLNPTSSGSRRHGIGGSGEAGGSDGQGGGRPKRNVRWSANQKEEDEEDEEDSAVGRGGSDAGRRKIRGRDSDSED